MQVSYIIVNNTISLVLGGKPYTIGADHINFKRIHDALKEKRYEDIEELLEVSKSIQEFSGYRVRIENNVVYYNDLPVHNVLTNRMIALMREGFDIQPWINFMEKLYTNPNPDSITQLYSFLERAKLPLTPDGDFLAYKYVTEDFLDCHTRTMDNSVGTVVEMDRRKVDSNPDNHCSSGLHFCSRGYLSGTFRTIVIVKVNPADVVSIPNDHNCEKARACRYKVVGVLDKDYSYDDMEDNEVLESPEEKPLSISQRIYNAVLRQEGDAMTVRQLSKNLRLTKNDIIDNVPLDLVSISDLMDKEMSQEHAKRLCGDRVWLEIIK